MKKHQDNSNMIKYKAWLLILTIPFILVAASCRPEPVVPDDARVLILDPSASATLPAGDITIKTFVEYFNLVDKLSQTNVPGEGHIHYFVDVDALTTPGQPAVTAAGTYAARAATSYTWHNVGGGPHKFSVELVNNDHTPLTPPVVASVSVTILPEIGPASVVITTPKDGSTIPAGDVTVSIQVSNFNVVDKQGQANVPREGHIHYFLDVDAPTTPDKPAIPASGVWAHFAATTYTFSNVAAGRHTISVELINNDHTPLTPPVVAKVAITVQAATTTPPPTPTPPPPPVSSQNVTIDLICQNMSFDKSTINVPAGASVTINFDNKGSGIPHNFVLYTDSRSVSE